MLHEPDGHPAAKPFKQALVDDGIPYTSFAVDNVGAEYERLRALGVRFTQEPLEKLRAYKRRMAGAFPGSLRPIATSTSTSASPTATSRCASTWGAILEGEPPPVLRQLAAATGTDVAGYVSEGPGFSAFVVADGALYHTYSTYARGLEFLMGYYPILDRAPKGRDEGESSALWIRRHDEYNLEQEER